MHRARQPTDCSGVGLTCTTAFKNAHGTIFRELLYPWHPWFAHRVAVHEAIGKPNEVVFRCTLSGSDAGRSAEIPAWMFDRTVCAAARLTAAPYVNATALSALRDLLWHALGIHPLCAITNSQRMREIAVMISSTMPSAKYSCSGSSEQHLYVKEMLNILLGIMFFEPI